MLWTIALPARLHDRWPVPLIALVAIVMALPACAAVSPPVEYTVSLPAPQTQMIEMAVTVPRVSGETLEFILPVWRPGRYTILDPSSSVREVRASDAATGEALAVEKVRKNAWRVAAGGAESVRVDYRVYANSLGDRTRHVDDTHAFLSPSSVFLYLEERRDDPVVVHIDAPPDWDVATGMEPHATAPRAVVAPNYDVLVNSPLEIGVHERLTFDVDCTPHEIILWGEADYNEAEITDDFAKIVRAQRDIFGDLPYQRYVFITHVGRGAGGGTEHLNSTIMQTSRNSFEDDDAYRRFLGLVAHEFFHTWNVKQLRPAGINPYDYERENYTRLLWVAEGTTSYYDELTLVRTGHVEPDDYLKELGRAIDALRRRPGRLVQSLEESSFDAWIKFSKSSPDDSNSTVSFYSSGALASLALDFEIRKRSAGAADLDDVMRTMYQRYPLDGPGYTPGDLLAVIDELSGSDFTEFFQRHVRGTEDFDFESVADACGLELVFEPADDEESDSTSRADDRTSRAREEAVLDDDPGEDADSGDGDNDDASDRDDDSDDDEPATQTPAPIPLRPYLGLELAGTRVSALLSDGPVYASGLLVGDELVAVDGRRVQSQSDLDARVKKLEPGDTICLTCFRHDVLREVNITLAGVPDGAWVLRRLKEPTDEQKAAFKDWLGQEW